jgi:hypothetical protein
MTTDQLPAAPDYRRAAQLYLHRENKNAGGFNNVMAEADQLGRLSALVLAVVNIARLEPNSTLATPEGITRLQDIAIEFGRRESIEPDDVTGR